MADSAELQKFFRYSNESENPTKRNKNAQHTEKIIITIIILL